SLPLVSPFAGAMIHDWNYLLSRMGLLAYDARIAFFIRVGAVLSMLVCLVSGGWLLWQIKRQKKIGAP
ncbi:MAG: hypothetical protein JSW40_04195, partial [Candidatus Omnitrophota bacterium]